MPSPGMCGSQLHGARAQPIQVRGRGSEGAKEGVGTLEIVNLVGNRLLLADASILRSCRCLPVGPVLLCPHQLLAPYKLPA